MPKINKIKVSTGIYWLSIPDASLHVLCGCPADSTKHLMKRGLIQRIEKNNIGFETGPDAVLLSDVKLQNGNFSNLAEFPILQMLYRQGMIIPGHPNNNGSKPLLIGSRDQVDAQIEYIYRGNYGLISEEEITNSGYSEEEARDLMRLKIRFAFNKIQNPKELIDTVYISSDYTEIRNGVFIKRTNINRFELTYEDEKEFVDLNLKPDEDYEAPYPLGVHQIEREYFSVIHSGEGDGWDVNRPSMGSIIVYQGKIYLIDAGPNIIFSLMSLGIGVNEIEGIFHTHSHDDHFAGLTALIRSDHRMKYFAPPLVRSTVTKKLSALLGIDESNFTYYFDTHDLRFGEWNDIEGLEVKPIYSPHPVETSIFIFRSLWDTGYKSYAHFADIISFDILRKMVVNDTHSPGLNIQWYNKIIDDYLTTVDIKKIDIGGGLIHGKACDFKDDKSSKIILSHTSQKLTPEERSIGSGAPFGTVDVLIPGNQDFIWRNAFEFLSDYFPTLPANQLIFLLNNKIATFNPETILIKEGDVNANIYLILTGNVEMLCTETGMAAMLSAGAIIGELPGLHALAAMETYRTLTFVRALTIPRNLYLEFVNKNNLFAEISHLQENREFLQKTFLFSESISNVVLNRIAKGMRQKKIDPDIIIYEESVNNLILIKDGQIQLEIGVDVFEILNPGDFMGEEASIMEAHGIFQARTLCETTIYLLPIEFLRDIPIVRLKMLEIFEKRMWAIIENDRERNSIMEWRNEYSVGIEEIDKHHIKLFEYTNSFIHEIKQGTSKIASEEALDFLIDYTRFHFKEEEAMLKRNNYPALVYHQEKHAQLLAQVEDIKQRFVKNRFEPNAAITQLLKEWIVCHILTEDRKYAILYGKNNSLNLPATK